MKIDVRTNGVHSMAKALEAFKAYHDDPNNVFALKDSILRSHHALETLFKDCLYQINPVLLIAEERKIKEVVNNFEKMAKGEAATILDETITTNLRDTIDRLKRLLIIRLDGREYALFRHSIEELCSFRNKLQHLGISANTDVIGRTLGIVIPRAIEILDTFPKSSPLLNTLKPIYAESESVIHLLRNNYDILIQDAVSFFSKKEFADQVLGIKIRDHGKVGAPPYFAELDVTGFLNYSYDMRRMLEWNWARSGKEATYEASVNISQPKFTKDDSSDSGVAEGKLELNAQIFLEIAGNSIALPEAEEKISVLRAIRIGLKVNLEYQADAFMNDWHYDVRKITSAEGILILNIETTPKGYTKEESQIIGEYKVKLNHENAPFRLHCFVEPGGTLSTNYSLDWNLKTTGNLKFR